MTTRLTRRHMLGAAVLPLLTSWLPYRPQLIREADEPLDAWIRRRGPELPELAAALASMEIKAHRQDHEDWRTRWRVDCIDWRPGVCLVYAVIEARQIDLLQSGVASVLRDAGIRILAEGRSSCRWAFTMFVVGDKASTMRRLEG